MAGRDLQSEWEPATFAWRLIHIGPNEMPMHEADWCCCMGPRSSPRPELGLCPCDYQRKFGIEFVDRVLIK